MASGTLSPDQTGVFRFDYVDDDGYDVFTHEVTAWHLWHEEIPMQWQVSQDVGEQGSDYWYLQEASPVGVYTPGGTATGDLTTTIND